MRGAPVLTCTGEMAQTVGAENALRRRELLQGGIDVKNKISGTTAIVAVIIVVVVVVALGYFVFIKQTKGNPADERADLETQEQQMLEGEGGPAGGQGGQGSEGLEADLEGES